MERNEKIINLLQKNSLKEEDTFEFGCIQCGQCCHNRHDILLQPFDLFRIAKYLGQDISTIINKYCDGYIGENSKMPILRAKPKIHDAVCPFLRKGKCSVHEVKPAVCALFPLGRATAPNGEMRYFIQNVHCNAEKTTVKVKDWLDMFHLRESEQPAKLWGTALLRLSTGKQKCKFSPEEEERLNIMLFGILYVKYDTEKEFLPQFERNIEEAEKYFEEMTRKSIDKLVKGVGTDAFRDIGCN